MNKPARPYILLISKRGRYTGMSGREKETAAKETAGVSGKIKFRIFLIALLLAGVVTGVVTSRMHAAAQEKMTALQEHMAGKSSGSMCWQTVTARKTRN